MLRWDRYGFEKSASGHIASTLCFFHPVGSAGHVVHNGTFGAQNVDALFFKLEWGLDDFHKKCVKTRYTELVFLHPVGFKGHVVHSSTFVARNIDALLFMLG
jgi:hypothetical protein